MIETVKQLTKVVEGKLEALDRILDPVNPEILVPKSNEQDLKMRGLVRDYVSDIRVVGIENLRAAVKQADGDELVLTTVRNHQTYFDIATARAAFESEGEKEYADAQVFPSGLEIYELYRDTHFPANEIAVMTVAPQDALLIDQGLRGIFGELTEAQRALLEACKQGFSSLVRRSIREIAIQVVSTNRLTIFPEAEFPLIDGLTQRPKLTTAAYFRRPGINLPIRQDGPHLMFAPDTEHSPNRPNKFVLEMWIGKHFTNDQVAKALAAVPEEEKIAENITEADIAFKAVVDLRPDRVDPVLIPFYAHLPSV